MDPSVTAGALVGTGSKVVVGGVASVAAVAVVVAGGPSTQRTRFLPLKQSNSSGLISPYRMKCCGSVP